MHVQNEGGGGVKPRLNNVKKNAQLAKDGFPNQDEIFDGFFHRALPVAVASLLGAAWEGGGGLVVNVMVVMPFL